MSQEPLDCSAFNCGWAYLGASMTMASDVAGNHYVLWNAGNTWSAKRDMSTALAGTQHAFPAIASGG